MPIHFLHNVRDRHFRGIHLNLLPIFKPNLNPPPNLTIPAEHGSLDLHSDVRVGAQQGHEYARRAAGSGKGVEGNAHG